MDEKNTHIIIGSKLQNITEKSGRYTVFFMDAILTFHNGFDAVSAYNKIPGEAYLWNNPLDAKTELIEAKLMKDYYMLRPAGH